MFHYICTAPSFYFLSMSSFMATPILEGLFTTWMPAFSRAAIFSLAPPLPPAMMAPAWPMRLPGGAVWPAIKPTVGRFLWLFFASHAAASSSASPPISPIMMMPSVSGSSTNFESTSMKLVPLNGSPPMPTTVD